MAFHVSNDVQFIPTVAAQGYTVGGSSLDLISFLHSSDYFPFDRLLADAIHRNQGTRWLLVTQCQEVLGLGLCPAQHLPWAWGQIVHYIPCRLNPMEGCHHMHELGFHLPQPPDALVDGLNSVPLLEASACPWPGCGIPQSPWLRLSHIISEAVSSHVTPQVLPFCDEYSFRSGVRWSRSGSKQSCSADQPLASYLAVGAGIVLPTLLVFSWGVSSLTRSQRKPSAHLSQTMRLCTCGAVLVRSQNLASSKQALTSDCSSLLPVLPLSS